MAAVLILLLYVLVGAAVIGLGVLLWLRSVASRKRYRCPQCGEAATVELMEASRCSTCGASLGPAH